MIHVMNGRRTDRRRGFTLVELMVVAAIIAVLLTLTVPAVTGLLHSSQGAQAENLIRASLMGTRYYAIRNSTVAGLRFQADGHMVMCYARNNDTVLTVDSYMNVPIYEMASVTGEAVPQLEGAYRVSVRDVGNFGYYYTWPPVWKANPEWLAVNNNCDGWFVYPVVLFAPTGKVILGQCIFYSGAGGHTAWHSSTAGSFGKATDITYAFQGVNSSITGPTVTTQPMLIDYVTFRGNARGGDIDQALMGLDGGSEDIMLDVNTGMIIRQNDQYRTQNN
ncbi:MAG: hypothetical protein BIFFINMI_01566 [Phycisphaerae bacterium]|nr:hypothetical protein [Phycisphaerae bacterium]